MTTPPPGRPPEDRAGKPRCQRVRQALFALCTGIAVAGMIGKGVPGSDASEPPTAPSGTLVPLAPARGPGPIDAYPLGLNQGIGAVPAQQVPYHDFTDYRRQVEEDAARAAALGTRWYRVNTLEYPFFSQRDLEASGWDFTHRDTLVRALGERDIEVLMMLGPARGNASCHSPVSWMPERYWPESEEGRRAFTTYVERVVERYDGDGIDDMPGLRRPIRWWQADNEPDLHWASCRLVGRDYATPEEYYALVQAMRWATRRADPRSHLVTCAMVKPERERGALPYVSRLFRLHGGDLVDSVDAVDLHDYSGSLATLGDKLETVRRTLRRPLPIWITETSVPGDPRANAAWDAERQAGALVRHLAAALSTGVVPRIFWHTLGDSPPNPGRREWRAFGTNALYDCFQPLRNAQGHQVCQDRRRKPVGEVFARLNELLRDYTRVEAWDARTVVFRRDGQPPWVAAWRDRGTQPVDLRRWFGDGRVRVQLATAGLPETLEDAGSVPVGMVPVLVTR